MANLAGKWKLEKSDKFEEYMKKLGVGVVLRKMAAGATPVTEISIDGDNYFVKTSTTFKSTEFKFDLGVECEETTGDGRKVMSTVIADGPNKLIQEQRGKPFDSTITRELIDDNMVMTLTVDDVVCTRIYKKID